MSQNSKETFEIFIAAMKKDMYLGLHLSGIHWQALHDKTHSLDEIKQADNNYINKVYAFLDQVDKQINLEEAIVLRTLMAIDFELTLNHVRKLLITHHIQWENFIKDNNYKDINYDVFILGFCSDHGLDYSRGLNYKGFHLATDNIEGIIRDYARTKI